MAKSSKSDSSEKSSAAKKPAAGAAKAPAKKAPAAASASPAKKPAAAAAKSAKSPATPLSTSLIDTDLAAQTAAAMVARRVGGSAAAGGSAQPQSESSSFKNLKESLSKPSLGSLGGILGPAGGQKKFNQHTGGAKQAGGARNQTFGADVNRTGVPRRTSG